MRGVEKIAEGSGIRLTQMAGCGCRHPKPKISGWGSKGEKVGGLHVPGMRCAHGTVWEAPEVSGRFPRVSSRHPCWDAGSASGQGVQFPAPWRSVTECSVVEREGYLARWGLSDPTGQPVALPVSSPFLQLSHPSYDPSQEYASLKGLHLRASPSGT